MVYTYTEQEKMKVLDTFMNDGKVKQVPSSTKKKYILLKEVLKRFDHGVTYTETEVNSILLNVFSSGDYVEQRRFNLYSLKKVQVCDIGSTPHT